MSSVQQSVPHCVKLAQLSYGLLLQRPKRRPPANWAVGQPILPPGLRGIRATESILPMRGVAKKKKLSMRGAQRSRRLPTLQTGGGLVRGRRGIQPRSMRAIHPADARETLWIRPADARETRLILMDHGGRDDGWQVSGDEGGRRCGGGGATPSTARECEERGGEAPDPIVATPHPHPSNAYA